MLLFAAAPALAAEPLTLAQLTVAPERYRDQEVSVAASFQMVMTKGMDDDCRRKDKAVLLALPADPNGVVPPGGAVQYEACVSVEAAMAVADTRPGTQLSVSGTVRVVKMMGSVYAIVLDQATIVPKVGVPAP